MAQLTRLKLPGPRLHLLFWGGNSTEVEITFSSFACLLIFHQRCIIFAAQLKYLQNRWEIEKPLRQNIHNFPP